jgi:hypothetical protein
LKDHGVNPEFEGIISFISLMTPPNASSSKQMKKFFRVKPLLFKPGANDVLPVRDDNKNLCKSILKTGKEYPS